MSTENTALAEPRPAKLIVQDNTSISYLMDTAKFEHCYRIAKLMATASLIPDHLRMDMKTKQLLPQEQVQGNCFMIVNQSLRWGFDPFAVAPETYIVGGKLAYQGKLVGAAVNALAGLVGDLQYEFSGKPGTDDFTITVIGQKVGEDKPRTVSVSVGQAKTDNQMWRKDPEQKLVYTGNIKWARRHSPGVIMGIMIQEDLEEIEMREATGRVVEPTTTKVITGNTEAPAAAAPTKAEAPAKPAKKPAKAAPKQEPEPEKTGMARPDMVDRLRAAFRAAGHTKPTAEAEAIKFGLLEAEKTFGDMSDDQMFALIQRLDEVYPPPAASEAIHAFYKGHTVRRSPEDSEKKWTAWQLQYEEAGGDGTVKHAVTFSSTFGKILDGLEGDEALILTIKSGEKGDSIQTLALAPTEGGSEA
jgi:hypothetical protein